MVKGGDLSDRLHYALESFYVFGKVLLDRVARAVEATLGTLRESGSPRTEIFIASRRA